MSQFEELVEAFLASYAIPAGYDAVIGFLIHVGYHKHL